MNAKRILLVSLVIVSALLIVNCGKDKGTSTGNVNTEQSADVDKFLSDYESFVTEYCSVTDQISTAPMMKKVKLMQGLAIKSTKLSKYANDSIAMKASMSASAQKKLDELQKKADQCSKKVKI
ncbi:hypothetical protein ACFL20_00750 [Spirochaetota bacterium]